nr:phage tail tape measure protein [Gammaproteobacteria bacterium]
MVDANLLIAIETLGLEEAERQMRKLSKEAARTADVVDRVGDEAAVTGKQVKGATAEVNKATAAVRGFGASGFIAVGSALTFAYRVTRAMGEASQASLDFGRSVGEVSTLIEGTTEQLDGLRASALSLASEFGGSATAQVEAYYQAYSAGAANAAAAQRDLIAANKLAVGGVADLIDSTSLIASVTNAYGRENYTATQASDLFFLSVRNGITTIPELGGYLANVTPVAAAFGVSLEEVSSSVAALTASGTRTRIAVTQIRALILSLQRATPEVQAFGAALGINLSPEGLSQEGGYARVITQLNAALDGLDQAAQGSILRGLFGVEVEALSAAASLAGGAFDNFTDTLSQAGDAAGLTNEAFEKIEGTLEHRYNVSLAKSNAAVIQIGDAINNRLIPVLEVKAGVLELIADNTYLVGAGLTILASFAVPALSLSLIKLGASIAVATGGLTLVLAGATALAAYTGFFYWTAEASTGTDRFTDAQQALAIAIDTTTEAQRRQTQAVRDGIVSDEVNAGNESVSARQGLLDAIDGLERERANIAFDNVAKYFDYGIIGYFLQNTEAVLGNVEALERAQVALRSYDNQQRAIERQKAFTSFYSNTAPAGEGVISQTDQLLIDELDGIGAVDTPLSNAISRVTAREIAINESLEAAYIKRQSLIDIRDNLNSDLYYVGITQDITQLSQQINDSEASLEAVLASRDALVNRDFRGGDVFKKSSEALFDYYSLLVEYAADARAEQQRIFNDANDHYVAFGDLYEASNVALQDYLDTQEAIFGGGNAALKEALEKARAIFDADNQFFVDYFNLYGASTAALQQFTDEVRQEQRDQFNNANDNETAFQELYEKSNIALQDYLDTRLALFDGHIDEVEERFAEARRLFDLDNQFFVDRFNAYGRTQQALADYLADFEIDPDGGRRIDLGDELEGIGSLSDSVKTLGDAFDDDLRGGVVSFTDALSQGLVGAYDDFESFGEAVVDVWK